MEPTVFHSIFRVQEGKWIEEEDQVVREVPVTIYVNGEELVTLLATPQHLEELAVGYLASEGFVTEGSQIGDMRVDQAGGKVQVTLRTNVERGLRLYGRRMVTSGCGRGSIFYQSLDALEIAPLEAELSISIEAISALVKELQARSSLFHATGGVHGAALAVEKGIILFREDIGRHNAVDKIAGRCLLEDLATGDKILLTSGRISSEMALKAAKLGVPVLISPSAPTDLAVQIARRLKLTLVGFARGNRFNVYSSAWRLRGPVSV